MIPENGKLSDKERSLLRLAKRQSQARQAQDERVCLERGMDALRSGVPEGGAS